MLAFLARPTLALGNSSLTAAATARTAAAPPDAAPHTRLARLPPVIAPDFFPVPSPFPCARQTAILWLRSDLRLHDHQALSALLARRPSCLVPVLVVPRVLRDPVDGRPLTKQATAFFLAAARALDAALRRRGSRLVLLAADAEEEDALQHLAQVVPGGDTLLSYTRGVTSVERAAEQRLDARVAAHPSRSQILPVWGNALYDLPENLDQVPTSDCDAFAAYMRRHGHIEGPFPEPDDLPPLPSLPDDLPVVEMSQLEKRYAGIPTATAGEDVARDLTDNFLRGLPLVEAGRAAVPGPFAKLNGSLSWGCLSPRWVYDQIVSQLPTTSLRRHCAEYELLLRDFFRFSALRYGNHVA